MADLPIENLHKPRRCNSCKKFYVPIRLFKYEGKEVCDGCRMTLTKGRFGYQENRYGTIGRFCGDNERPNMKVEKDENYKGEV